MAPGRRSRAQSAECVRLFLLHVVASLSLVSVVDAAPDATTTDWITATIDGQTVSWPNNYSPTSVAYTPSLLASSFFDPTVTSTTSSSSPSSQIGISSTSQSNSQTSTTPVATTNTSSASDSRTSSLAASTSTGQSSAGAGGEQSNLGAQSQGKTHHSSHSTAIIVGVVVGVVGLAVLGILLLLCRRRGRRRHASPRPPVSAGDSEKAHLAIYNRESQTPMLSNISETAYSDKVSSEGNHVTPTHETVINRKAVAGAGSNNLHGPHQPPVSQQDNYGSTSHPANQRLATEASHALPISAMEHTSYVPTILVTGDEDQDYSSLPSHDESEKPTAATSVSSYEGTRENSIRIPPKDPTPTMSRPHPLRSNPVPLARPETERLHSYQTITDDNPFGERAGGKEPALGHAAYSHPSGYTTSTAFSTERSERKEGNSPEDSSQTQYNWLGELRSPSPLCLTESLDAESQNEAPSGVPVDAETMGQTSAMARTFAPAARPRLFDLPSDEAVHGLKSSTIYEKATRGPRTYLAYSQLNETTGLLEERPRFVPGIHQISREEQYRQNRAARRSDPAASNGAADTAPAPPAPASPARTWRRSQPPQYLTQQEISTFDFGGQNLDSNAGKRPSLPPQDLDHDGEFGYLHGQRVRMYEGA